MDTGSPLISIILFTLLGSIGSLVGGFVLLMKERVALSVSHFLASFAAGVLLAFAFFDLLPEAAEAAEGAKVDIFFWTLVGILSFFLLERFIHWFHHHEHVHEHERESQSTVPLIIIGDTMHNFVDGVVIAATFLVDPQLGMVTTAAIAAHEIPQEIADFGLLLHKGLSKMRVVMINLASACAALVGALLTYFLGSVVLQYVPLLLAVTAGFFIYIATSDLIPEIQYEKNRTYALVKAGLLIVGAISIWIILRLVE
ncbi:ZIP family metal transporter [Candidatus Uhrbacteria bacterium]|nr:ZIP family metal transporter [Candidatus Uhrbacteria bacterium]